MKIVGSNIDYSKGGTNVLKKRTEGDIYEIKK